MFAYRASLPTSVRRGEGSSATSLTPASIVARIRGLHGLLREALLERLGLADSDRLEELVNRDHPILERIDGAGGPQLLEQCLGGEGAGEHEVHRQHDEVEAP